MKTFSLSLAGLALVSLTTISFAADSAEKQPEPTVITPGTAGSSPSAAIVLFDGKDLSAWKSEDGGAAPWKIENGYAEVSASAS